MTELTEDLKFSETALGRVLFLSLAVLILFAVNLFVLQPLISRGIGPRAAQFIYIIVRIIGLIGLAYSLSKNANRNRFQAVSTVLLVGFIDQVLFKSIWVKRDMLIHPADWVGMEPSNSMIFLNMSIGYLAFTPVILILAFVGMESTRLTRDWKVKPELPS
jgi:hypothetical protein